ncbi:MAG TPA: haloacid dehalogenase type II [Planctomycetota bacterium]|nr:haloacid dehalogenase type II [Planctomycetota bacterium]
MTSPAWRPAAITFDCYGTLIDWNRGIEGAIAAVPALRRTPEPERRSIRARREAIELERFLPKGYRPYREILAESLVEAAREAEIGVPPREAEAFAASMATWPPHADSPEGLARLREKFRLAILSNVDRSTLLASVRLLGVEFDLLVTAEDVRSYKPARAHFDRALAGLGLRPDQVLHVSYTAEHDLLPAQALGISTAWVKRYGAALPSAVKPRLAVPDLLALADALGA